MRRLAILVALASTALATPAVAQDHFWYAGVEGGAMLVQDNDFDIPATLGRSAADDGFSINHKTGVDVDLIGGYDFGFIRAEAEAGYKRASIDEITFIRGGTVDAGGSARVFSAMGNLLLDFSDAQSDWSGYIGGGLGLANVRYRINFPTFGTRIGGSGSDSDRSIAYQAIVGVRKSVSPNLDFGLKYRYFVAPKLDYDIIGGTASSKYRSHSLLASLVYNFAPPPPPVVVVETPLPPPPSPATQTCYDGSVILASDVCPQPPAPPPPPPEPAPERG